jgi:hypothetical protein
VHLRRWVALWLAAVVLDASCMTSFCTAAARSVGLAAAESDILVAWPTRNWAKGNSNWSWLSLCERVHRIWQRVLVGYWLLFLEGIGRVLVGIGGYWRVLGDSLKKGGLAETLQIVV